MINTTINFLASALTRRCVISSRIPSGCSKVVFSSCDSLTGSKSISRSMNSISTNSMIPYSSNGNTNLLQPRRNNANDDMSNALVRSTPARVSSTALFSHSCLRSMSSISTAPFQYPFFGYNATFLPAKNASTVQSRSFASQKHKRIIKMAKGYRGRANRTYRAAIRRVEKGLQYSYRDRKVKKRNFRRLWIERVNAGVRQHGMSYSRFIRGMQRVGKKKQHGAKEEDEKQEGILLNRKVLADLAANEPFSFKAVVDVVKMKMGQITGSK